MNMAATDWFNKIFKGGVPFSGNDRHVYQGERQSTAINNVIGTVINHLQRCQMPVHAEDKAQHGTQRHPHGQISEQAVSALEKRMHVGG